MGGAAGPGGEEVPGNAKNGRQAAQPHRRTGEIRRPGNVVGGQRGVGNKIIRLPGEPTARARWGGTPETSSESGTARNPFRIMW